MERERGKYQGPDEHRNRRTGKHKGYRGGADFPGHCFRNGIQYEVEKSDGSQAPDDGEKSHQHLLILHTLRQIKSADQKECGNGDQPDQSRVPQGGL